MPEPEGTAVSPRTTADSAAPCSPPPIRPGFLTEAPQHRSNWTAAHHIPWKASAHTLDASPQLAVPLRRCQSVGTEQPCQRSSASQGPHPRQEPPQVAITGQSGCAGHAGSALDLLLAEAPEASPGKGTPIITQVAAGLGSPAEAASSGGRTQGALQQRDKPPEATAGLVNDNNHQTDLSPPGQVPPDVPPPDDCLALLLSFFSKEDVDNDDDDAELPGGQAGSGPGDSDVTWQGSQDAGLNNREGLTQATDSAGCLPPSSVPAALSLISATVECLGCEGRRLSGSGAPPVTGACPAALAVAAAAAAAAVSAAGGSPGAATVTVTNDCEGLPQWLPASPFLPTLSPFLASLDHDDVEAFSLSEGTDFLPLDDGALDEHSELPAHDAERPYRSLQGATPYDSSPPSAPCSNRTISTMGSSLGMRKCSTSSSSVDDAWGCLPSAAQQAFALGDQAGTAVVRLNSVASSSAIAAWCHAQPGAHAKLEPGSGLLPQSSGPCAPGAPGEAHGPAQAEERASHRGQAEALYLINPLTANPISASHDHSASRALSPDAWVAIMGCYELPLDKHRGADPTLPSPREGCHSALGLICPWSSSGKQKRRRESSVQAEGGEGQAEGQAEAGGEESEGRESEDEGESGLSEDDKDAGEEEQEEQDSPGEDEGAEASFDLNVLFKSVEHKQWAQRGRVDARLEPFSMSGGTGHLPSTSCPNLCAVTDRLLHTNGTFHTRLEVHVHRLKSPDDLQSLLPATYPLNQSVPQMPTTEAPLEEPTSAQPGSSDSAPAPGNAAVLPSAGGGCGGARPSVDVHSEAAPAGDGAKPLTKIRRSVRLEELNCHVILHTQRSTEDWLHRLGMGTARVAGCHAAAKAVERTPEGEAERSCCEAQQGGGSLEWTGGDDGGDDEDPSPEAVDRQSYAFPRYSPTFMTMLLAEYNCLRSKDGFRLCHSSFSATLDQNKLAGAARARRSKPDSAKPRPTQPGTTAGPKGPSEGDLGASPGRTRGMPAAAALRSLRGGRPLAECAQGSGHKASAVFDCLEDGIDAVSPPSEQLHASLSAEIGARSHRQQLHQLPNQRQQQGNGQQHHQENRTHHSGQQPSRQRSGAVHPWPAEAEASTKNAQGGLDPFPLRAQGSLGQPGSLAQAGRSGSEPLGSPVESSPLLAASKRPSLQSLTRPPSAPGGSVRHSQSDSRLLSRSLPLAQDAAHTPLRRSTVAPDSVAGLLLQGSGSLRRADLGVRSSGSAKSSASLQRERSGKIQLMDLAQHFHLPINDAAKALGICPTVLKKICRRHGMRRWPHRKIRSLDRIIATLEETVAAGGGTAAATESLVNEIKALKREKEQLCAGNLGSL